MNGEKGSGKYRLVVPLDASGIQDFKPDQPVKVVARGANGSVYETLVRLEEGGRGEASFDFEAHPGGMNIAIGPGNASAEEIAGLQTLTFAISSRQWQDRNELILKPVIIPAYFWYWWLIWCREFVIRGRVICADGSPVPGAKVCAFDVDWWWIWSSTQQVGCAITDANGAFEIRFRWCCGWWPWWWWRYRVWQLNPILLERVGTVLKKAPNLHLSPLASNQPSLGVFQEMLAEQGINTRHPLAPGDVERLEGIRTELLKRLPAAAELEQLRIWPWWPWRPWWDCAPDIIFKVTQDCPAPGTVIVDEGIGATRWNVSSPLNVVLLANDQACCRPGCHQPPCDEGECVIIDRVCEYPVDDIGGNLNAPAAPIGYLHPGAIAPGVADYNGDRPFAGIVPVYKNPGDLLNVDYYEIEFSSNGGMTWNGLPPGTAVDFQRSYWDTNLLTTLYAPFPWTTKLDAASMPHEVVETREHREGVIGGTWDLPGADYFWLSLNWDMLVPLDSTKLPGDGTYSFRMVAWQVGGSGELTNRRVLPICGTERENNLVLTIDNQVLDPLTHDPSHNCGMGVHTCTQEPDTHILSVRINGEPVGPCETVNATEGTLEIDFLAHDVAGHLASYWLAATYGLSLSVNLLDRPGASVTALVIGTQTGWVPTNALGTYGVALSQGAVAPHWYGGRYRLTVPVNQAFPEPCCYQLELRAYKRTIVGWQSGVSFGCYAGYAHSNLTEYTLGVGVCP